MAPSRILVVRLSSMGDVIHALPAVASLKQSFPESHIAWVIRTRWAPLLAGNPHLDEFIPFERNAGGIAVLWRKLRADGFDVAIDFQGLIQSAMIAAAGSLKVVGLHRSQARERAAAWLYSTEVVTHSAHRVDQNIELASAAGATNLVRTFAIPQGEPEGTLPDGRFVLASPMAGWGAKQWPLKSYEALAAKLDLPLVVNGAPGSATELESIRGAQVHLSGIDGLIDATRRAHAVIGVDSGPMHLAAALGKPGVAIFGPTDPASHGPYGGSLRVLRSSGVATTYKRHAAVHESMAAITPDAVADALAASLEGCPA